MSPGTFGWLESVLLVRQSPTDIQMNWWSAAIYVDNTVNRESRYLAPRLRYARWDRPTDIKSPENREWPLVAISQHRLTTTEQKFFGTRLREVDRLVEQLKFFVTGLHQRNRYPRGYGKTTGALALSFERLNGCQTVEFDFGYDHEGNNFLKSAIERLGQEIEMRCRKPSASPFAERYSDNLQTRRLGECWDYHPEFSA
jgi:hypothetical protein